MTGIVNELFRVAGEQRDGAGKRTSRVCMGCGNGVSHKWLGWLCSSCLEYAAGAVALRLANETPVTPDALKAAGFIDIFDGHFSIGDRHECRETSELRQARLRSIIEDMDWLEEQTKAIEIRAKRKDSNP